MLCLCCFDFVYCLVCFLSFGFGFVCGCFVCLVIGFQGLRFDDILGCWYFRLWFLVLTYLWISLRFWLFDSVVLLFDVGFGSLLFCLFFVAFV